MASLQQHRPFGAGRWTVVAAATAALCWWAMAAGCASGQVGDDDDGSGATGNQGGGVGASTTTTTSSGTGGTGLTPTGTGTAVGGGAGGSAPCSEDPCRLTPPQCGCPQGQKCSFHSSQGAYCTPDGTIDGGEQCLGSGCRAGYICVGYGTPPDICRQFCTDDSDCSPPGGLCVLTLSGSGGASATLCSDSCDPITTVGCDVPAMRCDVLLDAGPPERSFTICLPAGSAGQEQPCSGGVADCAEGTSCFNVGANSLCLTWCDWNNPQCTVGTCMQTTPPTVVGSVEYGVCYSG